MDLYITRHGETDANLEQRYLGVLDPELNMNGKVQAQFIRDFFPPDIKAAIVSPMLRAQQTAQIIFRDSTIPIQTVAGFRERNVGVFEGLTQTEARTRYPDLWKKNITRQWHDAPTGGESIEQVVERVSNELNILTAKYYGQAVALIAHGFVAKVIRALARQDFADFFDWKLDNGKLLCLHLPEQLPTNLDRLKQTLPGS